MAVSKVFQEMLDELFEILLNVKQTGGISF